MLTYFCYYIIIYHIHLHIVLYSKIQCINVKISLPIKTKY